MGRPDVDWLRGDLREAGYAELPGGYDSLLHRRRRSAGEGTSATFQPVFEANCRVQFYQRT